jgi:hypothetical protein
MLDDSPCQARRLISALLERWILIFDRNARPLAPGIPSYACQALEARAFSKAEHMIGLNGCRGKQNQYSLRIVVSMT